MQKKQVAVLEIGSSKITAVVAERGINNTFIIKSRYSYEYEGYGDGQFYNLEELSNVISKAVLTLRNATNKELFTIYVGVPGEFSQVYVKNSQISFSSKKKIKPEDEDALYDSAFVMQLGKNKLINRSAVVYELDDCRRLANPIGSYSEILKGKLTFVVAKSYFIDVISSAINQNGVLNIEWISTTMAQAMYLLDDETRDRLAVVCDVGYISTTVSIIHGDGILYQDSFSYGGGYVTAMLTERFNLSFEVAEKLKRKANLCAINQLGNYDVIEDDDGKFYNGEQINECILSSLDELCEKISNSLDASGYVIPEYVSLMITGGGITYLRGAKEHVANRLGMSVEVLSPKVPMMDKPTESTLLSLLDMALGQN